MAPPRVTPIIITTDEEAKTARATARLVKQEIKDEKTKIAKWNKIKKNQKQEGIHSSGTGQHDSSLPGRGKKYLNLTVRGCTAVEPEKITTFISVGFNDYLSENHDY